MPSLRYEREARLEAGAELIPDFIAGLPVKEALARARKIRKDKKNPESEGSQIPVPTVEPPSADQAYRTKVVDIVKEVARLMCVHGQRDNEKDRFVYDFGLSRVEFSPTPEFLKKLKRVMAPFKPA